MCVAYKTLVLLERRLDPLLSFLCISVMTCSALSSAISRISPFIMAARPKANATLTTRKEDTVTNEVLIRSNRDLNVADGLSYLDEG